MPCGIPLAYPLWFAEKKPQRITQSPVKLLAFTGTVKMPWYNNVCGVGYETANPANPGHSINVMNNT